LSVLAGVSELRAEASGQRRAVEEIIVHERYISPERGSDIALLRLASPLDLSGDRARPIALVTPELAARGVTDPGVQATISGWGSLREGGTSPDRLQEVTVPIVSLADARAAYRQSLTDDQLPAGVLGVGGRDSCQGDSGGPLVVMGDDGAILAGVVSWGNGCARPNYPGLYARVSSFTSWIAAHTAIEECDDCVLERTERFSGTLRRGEDQLFGPFQVGAETAFRAATSGTGDADLYVRFDEAPTRSQNACRSESATASEACTLPSPRGARTAYVLVHGYSDTRFELSVTYTPSDGGEISLPENAAVNLTHAADIGRGENHVFQPIAVEPSTGVVVAMSGSGDADIYAAFGRAPSSIDYDCRPFAPTSNERCELTAPSTDAQLFIAVNGYAAGSYSLDVRVVPQAGATVSLTR
jgi:hypothetical protein